MTKAITLNFTELRAICIAIHERGQDLLDESATFSHGSQGHDWQRLAKRVDELVASGENGKSFFVYAQDFVIEERKVQDQIKSLMSNRIAQLQEDVISYQKNNRDIERLVLEAKDELAKFSEEVRAREALWFQIKILTGTIGKTDDQTIEAVKKSFSKKKAVAKKAKSK